MSVVRPNDQSLQYAMFRVLAQPPGQPRSAWQVLPMVQREDLGQAKNGFWVEEFERVCLPATGSAILRYQYGFIDGKNTLLRPETSGEPTDVTTENEVFNLRKFEIRIQASPKPTDKELRQGTFQPSWRTVWLGTCEAQTDMMAPGAGFAHGMRIYHCVDGLARTRLWPMRRHGFRVAAGDCVHVLGHPGYNALMIDGHIAGNREGTSYTFPGEDGNFAPQVDFHTFPSVATGKWNDLTALTHALHASRGVNDPIFDIEGVTSPLSQAETVWAIDPDRDTVFDFMCRVLDRRRGRGLAFLDWDDDSDAPEAPIFPYITMNPEHYDSIEIPDHVTLPGALASGTTVDVDLIGDHCNDMASFVLGERIHNQADYLETLGERIEVMVTLSFKHDDLSRRFAESEITEFKNRSNRKRLDRRFDPVFQRWGLTDDPLTLADDGSKNSARSRYDYRCDDDGVIQQPGNGDERDTSPLVTELLHDLPIMYGYDYTNDATTRWDAANDLAEPVRQQPFVLLRVEDDKYIDAQAAGFTLAMVRRDLIIAFPQNKQDGFRAISDTTEPKLGASFNEDDLVVTVAVRLPHRVRFASGDPNGRRKMRIFHDNKHLWLAHPDAIWELDGAHGTAADTYPPFRNAVSGNTEAGAGIIRDDRDTLKLFHFLSKEWYQRERRPVKWALKDCGFLPYTLADGSSAIYPRIGEVVDNMKAGGMVHQIKTPITRIHYDCNKGVTTWETDWQDLDWQKVPTPTRGLAAAPSGPE